MKTSPYRYFIPKLERLNGFSLNEFFIKYINKFCYLANNIIRIIPKKLAYYMLAILCILGIGLMYDIGSASNIGVRIAAACALFISSFVLFYISGD